MIKNLTLIALVLLGLLLSVNDVFSQAPYAFNYQGIAHDADGEPLKSQDITLRISLIRSHADGDIVFAEEHDVTTDQRGLFAIRIGLGHPILGNLRAIKWDKDQYFIRTEIDVSGGTQFMELGSSQLYSVPYALYAMSAGSADGNSGNTELELAFNNNSNLLSIKDGNSVDLSSLAKDDDADPMNELQTLSITGDRLSISNGNMVDLSSLTSQDADADPTNEIQKLSISGDQLSISDGNTVDLSALTSQDADSDPMNELQRLSIAGEELFISNGNSIDLSSLPKEDADADPSNEIQELSISGDQLSISNGNTVNLSSLASQDADADPMNEIQKLSIAGNELFISNGNSVDLSALTGDDADADPMNELQTLSIEGHVITISEGNSITLPTSQGVMQYWEQVFPGGIHYMGDEVSVGESSNTPGIIIGEDEKQSGFIALNNAANESTLDKVYLDADFGNYALDDDGELTYELTTISDKGYGYLGLYSGGRITDYIGRTTSESGYMATYGPNGKVNVELASRTRNANHGSVSIANDEGNRTVSLLTSDDQYGIALTNGQNGELNAAISALSGSPNHGFISVHDAAGESEAGMYVNTQGQGVLFADIKNFRTSHPTNQDQDIVYASLEGPEAAAYMRGTATMVDGVASVTFPEHFQHIINEQGMTVMLTPLSADSKGLAVVKKSKNGIEVRELANGKGNYSFDWEVKGVRAGYENYKVIREKSVVRAQMADVQEGSRTPILKRNPPKREKR